MNEPDLLAQINSQLAVARETVWTRYPLPTQFPCFRSAPRASQAVLTLFRGPLLIARDPSLRCLREAALKQHRTVVIPDQSSTALYRIPGTAMVDGVLRISPIPSEAQLFCGAVAVLVVGCHAFDPMNRWVYGIDSCVTGNLIASLPELQQCRVPVVCMASDAQQVSGWPRSAEAHQADLVVTGTRLIRLGTGETEML